MRDMLGMMGKIKELQANMERMQAELETLEVTGSAGGGLVSVTTNAKGAIRKVSIDPSLMKADEKEISRTSSSRQAPTRERNPRSSSRKKPRR
jgi:DNA-binding YbaB/EbfC family protein